MCVGLGDRLAIWVAWSIRWPDLVKNLFDGIWREEIRGYLNLVSGELDDEGQWKNLGYLSIAKKHLTNNRLTVAFSAPFAGEATLS